MSKGTAEALNRLRVIRQDPAADTDDLMARLRRLGYRAPGGGRWTAFGAQQVFDGWERRGWATCDRYQSGMKQIHRIRLTPTGRRLLRDAEVREVGGALVP